MGIWDGTAGQDGGTGETGSGTGELGSGVGRSGAQQLGALEAARRVVAALIDAGVGEVVIAPGSRSAPLAYALAAASDAGCLRLHVRIDERVAGFTALGLGLGSGRPVAVATTSGTAVGELLPAVMEAAHGEVPLVVLSADRPDELRGTGANQTTRQAGLFGRFTRYDVDIAAGTDPVPAVIAGLAAATGTSSGGVPARGGDTYSGGTPGPAGMPSGPVQLNLAFRDPLAPAPDEIRPDEPQVGRPQADEIRSDEPEPGELQPEPSEHDRQVLDPGPPWETNVAVSERQARRRAESEVAVARPGPRQRTVVVAGAGAGPVAEAFARGLGLPLLAEPSSNARFGPAAIGPYRLLLDAPAGPAADIEAVVVFGRPTLSRQIARLLADPSVAAAMYVPAPVAWFDPGRRREMPIVSLDELASFAGIGPAGWLDRWRRADTLAEEAIDEVLAGRPRLTGPALARALWKQTSGQLILGSSNPIRDLDLAGTPRRSGTAADVDHAVTVYANRGLAGIDGTVATATGIALARPNRPSRLLVGDLTFLHDVGALLPGAGEPVPDLQVVVLNDAGGGIFSVLEHGEVGERDGYSAAVERLFGTPQAVDLAALAGAYGWAYLRADGTDDLVRALAAPIRGRSILEVRASRRDLRALHARLKDAVVQAVSRLG